MNVIVTGGFGHVGIYLVKKLLEAGDNVVVYDISDTPNPIPYDFDPKSFPNFTLVKGDITDLAALETACRKHNIDHMAHMTAMLAAESKLDPLKSVNINCLGTAHAFEVARRLNMKRVVWASSISVYGHPAQYGNKPLPNDAPHYPGDLYGVGKSFGERLATIYSDSYGLNVVGIRFPQGFGIGRTRGGGLWTTDLFQNSMTGKPITIPNGDDTHNWILVEDEADVIFTALKAPKIKSGSYNMCGEIASKKEVVEMVRELAPNIQISLAPGKRDHCYQYDDTLLTQEIGWKPKHTLREGVRKTVQFAKQRLARM